MSDQYTPSPHNQDKPQNDEASDQEQPCESGADTYQPPRLRPIGTLPASTGMPTSALTFPPTPTS